MSIGLMFPYRVHFSVLRGSQPALENHKMEFLFICVTLTCRSAVEH